MALRTCLLCVALLLTWSAQADSTLTPFLANLRSGKINAAHLRTDNWIGRKILAEEAQQQATVYQGAKAPVFQVVFWGPEEKPNRVLIEFDVKKHELDWLKTFDASWATEFKSKKGRSTTLDSFVRSTTTHLKDFCEKLAPGNRCLITVWQYGSHRVTRLDVRMQVGVTAVKAIEYERK